MIALNDTPVREGQLFIIAGLLKQIPDYIPNSTSRTCSENLRWMMTRCIEEAETFPIDKTGRWIGFVQGVLALSGILDVDDERDRTRDAMHVAYVASGQAVPKSQSMV